MDVAGVRYEKQYAPIERTLCVDTRFISVALKSNKNPGVTDGHIPQKSTFYPIIYNEISFPFTAGFFVIIFLHHFAKKDKLLSRKMSLNVCVTPFLCSVLHIDSM